MAINLATRYPGRANPADTNYPQGSFKNRSAPGVLDGSYLEKDWANDFFAFFQQSLVEAGISPNDTVDNATNSQYYQALKSVFAEKNDFLSIATTAFEASVTNGDAVYWDSANSRFDEAIADGTNKQNMIGFADVTNGRVILMGAYSGQLIGLTPGAKYYLSSTVAGSITTTVPTNNGVTVGISKSATEIFVDVDASGTVPLATDSAAGIVELATNAEAQAGIDTTRAITPSNLNAVVAGMGQTWQDLTASRALGVNYTNSSGRLKWVNVSCTTTSGIQMQLISGGITFMGSADNVAGSTVAILVPVLAGQTYNVPAAGKTLQSWKELI